MIVTRQQQLFGVGLLVFVNIVWVAASEITRYLFIDLGFKRPFFFTYAKSCMLSLFLLHYACSWGRPTTSSNSSLTKTRSSTAMSKKAGKAFYSRLNDNEEERPGDQADEKLEMNEHEEEEEDEDFDVTLTEAEFEPVAITDVESNTGGDLSATESQGSLMDNNHNHNSSSRHPDGENSSSSSNGKRKQQRRKRVRFSRFREVRSWPQKLEQLANLARKPYTAAGGAGRSATDLLLCGSGGCCSSMFANSTLVSYSLGFAPLWLLSSVSYQTALAHSSVSSVNLISASAPLFVLMLSAVLGRRSSTVDSFNWFKLVLVLMNLGGVCIVSRFSDSVLGSLISLFSAFTNALYLFALSRLSMREQEVNMPLMLGIVGIFSLLVCTPLMIVLHGTGIEPQLPLPSVRQLLVLVANSFLGTLFADSLWLYATLLTGSLVSALSTSLGIPLSMLADSVFRNQPPNLWQLISSIPIMISFVGASMLTSNSTKVGSLNPNGNNGGNNNNNSVQPATPSASAASSLSSRSSIGGGQSGSDDQRLLLIDGGGNNDDDNDNGLIIDE